MTTPKNPAAVALGRKGGLVRSPRKGGAALTPEQRQARAALMVAAKRAEATAKLATPAAPTTTP